MKLALFFFIAAMGFYTVASLSPLQDGNFMFPSLGCFFAGFYYLRKAAKAARR